MRPRHTAETIPAGMPTSAAMETENSARKKVGSARSAIAWVTGRCRKIDCPEIAGDDLLQPKDELHEDRLVETIDLTQMRDVLGGRLIAQHERGRVARREPRQEEHHGGDEKHHDHETGETSAEVVPHEFRFRESVRGEKSAPDDAVGRMGGYLVISTFQNAGHGIGV